ncbi:hypothetical protein [Streptomyces gobiensis]|uniref:hypothetical protein n=1 Tax=Streptomyces gobiensis TaxID=2875706 RepID=UPI001E29CB9C|nr:hypothetical protein [Streptomyces gobiensis]UGY92583.1 hypothetical protein test1122_13205 [Streptomyces gobiensis]
MCERSPQVSDLPYGSSGASRDSPGSAFWLGFARGLMGARWTAERQFRLSLVPTVRGRHRVVSADQLSFLVE